jgi:ATP-dependent helicase/nuclease subunit A
MPEPTMQQPLAFERNGRPIAREDFYAIACDPRRSVAVEACAGAGKTWMLVSRMLRALLLGTQPHEILAITFTRKAAGEMKQRLYEWLEAFAQADDAQLEQALCDRGLAGAEARRLVEPLRALYGRVLLAGRPVQIRTFHGWFAALLRNAPLAVMEELGLPAQHELLEDDSEAVALVWRRFHGQVAADAQARQDFLDSVAAHGRSQTQKALLAALSRRIEFALADAAQVVDESVRPWPELFGEFGEEGEPQAVLAREGAVRACLLAAAQALGRASAPTFAAKGVQLEAAIAAADMEGASDALLTQKGEPRKFSEKLQSLEAVREAQDLVQRLAAAVCQHQAWLHHRRMARLARVLLGCFAALKRERGWIDMNDVEQAARRLLDDPVLSGWVQERLDLQVRQLLIDEFQDTNPLQWQALGAWLAGYAGAGGQAPGVFLVGDPKQSIYRFRRAEPQVFQAAQHFIVTGLEGDLLSCDHTHRNAPAVLAAVNQVMAAAQEAGEFHGFRTHTTQSQVQGEVACLPQVERPPKAVQEATGEEMHWRDSLSEPRELPEEKLAALECRQAAAWVAAQLRAGRKPADLMVLARKRERLVAMEVELRALRIPAQQPEKALLGDAPEVQDIVALLDVLVSPAHDLSLARALKSPLFSLLDAQLVPLALAARAARAQQQPRSWFELLCAPDAGFEPALQAAAGLLLGWKKLAAERPPHDVLDAVFYQGRVLQRFAQAAPPALRAGTLANLRALLGAALQVDGGRYATPYALVRALKSGVLRAPAAAAPDAVRLLTVHGAKGLEAPVVLLLDTDSPSPKAETMGVLLDWPGQEQAPLRFGFMASETRPPACSIEALEVERAARHREELNALYVAMTRAGRQLVLSSLQPYQASEGSWWQRLQPLAVALPAPAPAEVLAADDAAAPFELRLLPDAVPQLPPAAPPVAPDSEQSRFGQAMHRLLERWVPGASQWPAAQLARVAREFGLAPARMEEAVAMARRILQGEGGWAWDAAAIDWQANEVELVHEGEAFRLDRLVRRRDTGAWWVLDYKSASQPERDPSLLAQMQRYRAAVALANPGAAVQAALLTGQGRLVEIF